MSTPGATLKGGAQASVFVGGSSASLHIKGSARSSWTVTAKAAEDNREALSRVLTAALCWLQGSPQLIEPALRGCVVVRFERQER